MITKVAQWLSQQPDLGRARVDQCAEDMGYTRYKFYELFNESGGCPFQELKDVERMSRLRKLQDQDPSIDGEQCAKVLGFCNGDVFRKWYYRNFNERWSER